MDNISRKDLDAICRRLRMYGENEDFKLADILENADIIPKLYQRAYIESLYQRLKNVRTPYQFQSSVNDTDGYLSHLVWKNETIDAIQEILGKAHSRQDEICDFDDATLPIHIIGKCMYENHYENNEDIELTEKEQEIWDRINDEDGYTEAWQYFDEKINPDDQKLTLTLSFNDDETKLSKNDGEYVCDSCLEEISENADGGVSCDMEYV